MSHFAVAVFSDGKKTVEDLLAPYSENITVPPYIYETKEKIINTAKKRRKEALEAQANGKELSDFQKEYLAADSEEKLYQCDFDEDETYDQDGNLLTTYNPNSKWDWWVIGGRWNGLLTTKNGDKVDSAQMKDLAFDADKKAYDYALRYWEVNIDGSPLKAGENKEDFFNFYKKEFYLERYGNKETYAKITSSFKTYAVITPDGVWHEKGKMGWFGCSSETGKESLDWDLHFKERFIDKADPAWMLTVVDCHI